MKKKDVIKICPDLITAFSLIETDQILNNLV
jgi:hypothetical protein